MTRIWKKAGLFAALVASATLSVSPAEARSRYYGRGHDNTDTAIIAGIAGLAIGAAIASSGRDRYYYRDGYRYRNGYYYDRGYYPRYSYSYRYAPRYHYRDRYRDYDRGWRGNDGWRDRDRDRGRWHRDGDRRWRRD